MEHDIHPPSALRASSRRGVRQIPCRWLAIWWMGREYRMAGFWVRHLRAGQELYISAGNAAVTAVKKTSWHRRGREGCAEFFTGGKGAPLWARRIDGSAQQIRCGDAQSPLCFAEPVFDGAHISIKVNAVALAAALDQSCHMERLQMVRYRRLRNFQFRRQLHNIVHFCAIRFTWQQFHDAQAHRLAKGHKNKDKWIGLSVQARLSWLF